MCETDYMLFCCFNMIGQQHQQQQNPAQNAAMPCWLCSNILAMLLSGGFTSSTAVLQSHQLW